MAPPLPKIAKKSSLTDLHAVTNLLPRNFDFRVLSYYIVLSSEITFFTIFPKSRVYPYYIVLPKGL